MPYVKSPQDGASLFYVDYRPAKNHVFRPDNTSVEKHKDTTLFFIHGWPMNGRMYEHLMLPLSQTYGIRCIASDRRGFGRSEWTGNQATEITYETFALDTLQIIKAIPDLGTFTFVCASMGCGESLLVYELMKKYGLERQVEGFVWLGPSLPYPLQTVDNPQAPSRETWDMILNGLRQDRVGFVKASVGGIFGTQHGIEMSEFALDFFCSLIHQADAIAIERCCELLINYDFSDKLKALGEGRRDALQVTVLHGRKDQSMPLEASAARIQELVPGVNFKIYENAAHGLYYTAAENVLHDILAQVDKSAR